MKTETFSAIVVCSSLLLVHGLRFKSSHKNGIANSSKPIIYGALANPGDFPYLVLIGRPKNKKLQMCSGVVIHKHIILTAAHCTWRARYKPIQIFPSTWKPGDVPKIHVKSRANHPEATGRDYSFDVGLIKTKEDLVASGQFEVIPLAPYGKRYAVGTPATVAGWGIVEHGNKPGPLMRGTVPLSSWEECNRTYTSAKKCEGGMACPIFALPDHAFCIQSTPPKYYGSCVGDAGGPVVIDGVLAGVMSGTILTDSNKCNPKLPGLIMQVSDFVPWIKEILLQIDIIL